MGASSVLLPLASLWGPPSFCKPLVCRSFCSIRSTADIAAAASTVSGICDSGNVAIAQSKPTPRFSKPLKFSMVVDIDASSPANGSAGTTCSRGRHSGAPPPLSVGLLVHIGLAGHGGHRGVVAADMLASSLFARGSGVSNKSSSPSVNVLTSCSFASSDLCKSSASVWMCGKYIFFMTVVKGFESSDSSLS